MIFNPNLFKKSATTNIKFNLNNTILKGSHMAVRLSIPFGQTCYILTDGVLNAIKVQYLFAAGEGGDLASGLWCAAESAKDGGKIRCYYLSHIGVSNNTYNQPTRIFSSVEAFKRKGESNLDGDVSFIATPLAPYVAPYAADRNGSRYSSDTTPFQYYTIDEEKNVQSHDFISHVWADKDGIHLYPTDYLEFADKGNAYISSEAAYRAKRSSVEVIDFKPQPKPKKERNYEISITVSAKATTKSEAKKKLIEAITAVGLAEAEPKATK